MTKKAGSLYLIPNIIGDKGVSYEIPADISKIVKSIKYFVVEDLRTVRRYLKKLDSSIIIDDLEFFLLNKHTDSSKIMDFFQVIFSGEDIGLISEAGSPCVADPGNEFVKIAQECNVKVVPLAGPSSIIMALMASGMNGQNFAFNGYLPINKAERIKKIKHLEHLSVKTGQTQIFMETPYRNMKLLEDLLKNCNMKTQLCIASSISTNSEFIKTMSISEWKTNLPNIHKNPSIFIIQAK